jgi:uncharacterized ubiquitin-like protein YukD
MKGKIFVSEVSGLQTIEEQIEIEIFPNPANDFITCKNKSNSLIQELKIIDISGRTIKIFNKPDLLSEGIKLDIQNIDKGVYFISLISDRKQYIHKLLKL